MTGCIVALEASRIAVCYLEAPCRKEKKDVVNNQLSIISIIEAIRNVAWLSAATCNGNMACLLSLAPVSSRSRPQTAAVCGAQRYLRLQQCRCNSGTVAACMPLTFASVRQRLSDDDFLMVIWEMLKVEQNVVCSHLKTIFH